MKRWLLPLLSILLSSENVLGGRTFWDECSQDSCSMEFGGLLMEKNVAATGPAMIVTGRRQVNDDFARQPDDFNPPLEGRQPVVEMAPPRPTGPREYAQRTAGNMGAAKNPVGRARRGPENNNYVPRTRRSIGDYEGVDDPRRRRTGPPRPRRYDQEDYDYDEEARYARRPPPRPRARNPQVDYYDDQDYDQIGAPRSPRYRNREAGARGRPSPREAYDYRYNDGVYDDYYEDEDEEGAAAYEEEQNRMRMMRERRRPNPNPREQQSYPAYRHQREGRADYPPEATAAAERPGRRMAATRIRSQPARQQPQRHQRQQQKPAVAAQEQARRSPRQRGRSVPPNLVHYADGDIRREAKVPQHVTMSAALPRDEQAIMAEAMRLLGSPGDTAAGPMAEGEELDQFDSNYVEPDFKPQHGIADQRQHHHQQQPREQQRLMNEAEEPPQRTRRRPVTTSREPAKPTVRSAPPASQRRRMDEEDDNDEGSGTLDVPFPTWMTMAGRIKDPKSEDLQFMYPTSNLPKDERERLLLETAVASQNLSATDDVDPEDGVESVEHVAGAHYYI